MMDLVAYAPRRPDAGETIKGNEFLVTVGGKGFNQAVAASRAGAQTSILGCFGGDSFGETFKNALTDEGIDAKGVESDNELGTGVGLPVVSPDGNNGIIIIPRANDLVDMKFIHRHHNIITSSDVLLLQLELPKAGTLIAAEIAKKSGICVVLTPSPVAALGDFVNLIDILVPNEIEAAELAKGISGVQNQAKYLMRAYGLKGLVITLGPLGAYATDGTASELIAAPAVQAIDSVGAGDTLCGYLAAQLAAGINFFEATRLAVFAASFSVTRRGAALSAPRYKEVLSFLQQSPIEVSDQ